MSKKYAELVKGNLSQRGDVDLTKYYIVNEEMILLSKSSKQQGCSIQVSLNLALHKQFWL